MGRGREGTGEDFYLFSGTEKTHNSVEWKGMGNMNGEWGPTKTSSPFPHHCPSVFGLVFFWKV